MSQSREYTEDEVKETFLEHIRGLVSYWEKESRAPTSQEKLSGLAFSILSTLDGCSVGLPGFTVSPDPHPDDKEFNISRGENWYPIGCNIAGSLHEQFHTK